MTDIHAGLGISQIQRLDEFVSLRHEIADRYHSELSSLPITIPFQALGMYSSFHLYPIRVNQSNPAGHNVKYMMRFVEMESLQICITFLFIDNHITKILGSSLATSPKLNYFIAVISFPIYTTLSISDQQHVVQHSFKGALYLIFLLIYARDLACVHLRQDSKSWRIVYERIPYQSTAYLSSLIDYHWNIREAMVGTGMISHVLFFLIKTQLLCGQLRFH